MSIFNKTTLSKEEKKFEKKLKRRNVGLIMNLVGSSSLILLTIFLAAIVWITYLLVDKNKIQNGITSSVESLDKQLREFIENLKGKFSAEEIYDKIMNSIKTDDISITINKGTEKEQVIKFTSEQITSLVSQILPKDDFVKMINNYLDFGDIKLPTNEIIKNLNGFVDKFPWESFNKITMIALIATSSLAVVHLLNIIFASRLIIANGIISKMGFIITSIASLNLINWIGLAIFGLNHNKKANH